MGKLCLSDFISINTLFVDKELCMLFLPCESVMVVLHGLIYRLKNQHFAFRIQSTSSSIRMLSPKKLSEICKDVLNQALLAHTLSLCKLTPSSKEDVKEYTCGVCYQVYDCFQYHVETLIIYLKPYTPAGRCAMVLTCGHTYCRACLHRLYVEGSTMCPLCRTNTWGPFDIISKNYALMG